MNEVPRRVAIPNQRGRDTRLAVVIACIVVALAGWAILSLSRPQPSRNILRGEIIATEFHPQREQQVEFSGRALKGTEEIAGEYLLKVKVPPEGCIYEVPVNKTLFETRKVGDRLEFLRPESEQR